jgi:hypothetical protein
MNVLLISQAYPPYPVVGSLRARKVADALRAEGHRVLVITERLPGETNELRQDEPDLQVYTVPLGLQYRLRMVRLRDRLRSLFSFGRASATTSTASDETAFAPSEARKKRENNGFLHRLLLAALWFPDDEQRFVRPAYRAARAIMRRERIDLVYTSTPPFSTHIVGLLLRRRTNVRWVAEFRDPWTDQRDADAPNSIATIETLHRWLEQQCLQAADLVVAVTESARDLLASKRPENEHQKFLVALNGIDTLSAQRPSAVTRPFRIVYAGNFYINRDPRPFLSALAATMQRRGLTAADVAVDFLGECRTYEGQSVEEMVSANGLSDIVQFHDWMPHEQAQAMMRRANLLLLIALGQPLQVPNKLFEYLGTRIPILGLVDAGGETQRMLLRVGGQYVVSCNEHLAVDAHQVERALDAALSSAPETPVTPVDEIALEEWRASRQMLYLVQAVCGEGARPS